MLKFTPEIELVLNNIANGAIKLNIIPFLAGGAIREHLLNRPLNDIDIVVNKDAEKLATYLATKFDLEQPIQMEKSGAVMIRFGEVYVDIINMEKIYGQIKQPLEESREGMMTSLLIDDAFRRDLTINSLFYNLLTKKILDPTGKGYEDIKGGIVRTIISPYEKYKLVPSDILRAIRFYSENPSFVFGPDMLDAMKINAPLLKSRKQGGEISPRLIERELRKIARKGSIYWNRAKGVMDELQLQQYIDDEIKAVESDMVTSIEKVASIEIDKETEEKIINWWIEGIPLTFIATRLSLTKSEVLSIIDKDENQWIQKLVEIKNEKDDINNKNSTTASFCKIASPEEKFTYYYADGTISNRYSLNKPLGRADGPAVIGSGGTQIWIENDKMHNENRPAYISSEGEQKWFYNNVELSDPSIIGKSLKQQYIDQMIDNDEKNNLVVKDVKKVSQTITENLYRFAQTQQQILSPSVEIEPTIKADISETIEEIKKTDPNFFVGVSKIVGSSGSAFGQVSSKDPSVIEINIDRIKQQAKQEIPGFDISNESHKKGFNEIVKRHIEEVLYHEKKHCENYDENTGTFPGGESVAEQGEQIARQKYKHNEPVKIESSLKSFCKIAKSKTLPRPLKDVELKQQLPGGLGDKKQPSDFDEDSLEQGLKVELEHTNDEYLALEIVIDHLTEDKDYYKKLKKMEGSLKGFCKIAKRKQDKFYYEDGTTSTKRNIEKTLHRIDGPAIEWANGRKFWYYYGILFSVDEQPRNWPPPSDKKLEQLLKTREVFKELQESNDTSPFKYAGPERLWVQIDNTAEDLQAAAIKGEVCVTPFGANEKIFFEGPDAFGYVWRGKPSHLFPFDVVSEITSDGHRYISELEDFFRADINKEGWLDPSKSKLVGLIYVTGQKSKDDFINNDEEGLKFFQRNLKFGLRGFLRLSTSQIIEIFPNDLLEPEEQKEVELEQQFDKTASDFFGRELPDTPILRPYIDFSGTSSEMKGSYQNELQNQKVKQKQKLKEDKSGKESDTSQKDKSEDKS